MNKTISSKRYADLVGWLKQARSEQDLSMRTLAERLAQPHTFIQKVEALERKLDVYEYVQYCEALGVDPRQGLVKHLMREPL